MVDFTSNNQHPLKSSTRNDTGKIAEPQPAFELFSFKKQALLPRPVWIIRGLLIEKTLSLFSAGTGEFKSFLALLMALCIAWGRPFMGRETKKGCVVYVAAEGFYTILDRATGFALHYGCELPENFHTLRVPVNLGNTSVIRAFANTIEKLNPAILIFDTLSQCAEGANENDNGQMADFMRGGIAVCERIGAHVMILHHNGKATGTFRGAGSIKANVDTHISLERPENDENNTVFFRCEKQRGKEFEPFALRGSEITLPYTDEFGDPITSLVFEPCNDEVADKTAKHPNKKRSDKTSTALMKAFDEVACEAAAFGIDGVKIGFWKEKVCPEDSNEMQICSAPTFWRYRKSLEKSGAIVEKGSHNGSPLYQRATPTISTISTIKTQNDSNDSEPKTSVEKATITTITTLWGDSNDSTDNDRPGMIAPLPEMPPLKGIRKKNAQAESEAYFRETEVAGNESIRDIFDDE